MAASSRSFFADLLVVVFLVVDFLAVVFLVVLLVVVFLAGAFLAGVFLAVDFLGVSSSSPEATTAVTVSGCSWAAAARAGLAAARLLVPEAALVDLAEVERVAEALRRGVLRCEEADSGTSTVTPSLARLRSTDCACDIGISASSKARRTSSGSREPWDRPRSISC